MKNASPGRVVLVSSLIIFSLVLALELLAYLLPILNFPVYHLVIVPIVAFAAAVGAFYSALQKFIYEKIKVIYKSIHELRSKKMLSEGKIDMSRDLFSEINDDVMSWAKDKRLEIDKLLKQADYRKEFLGNVSHELKTPIMSIQGYLETLNDGGLHDERINKLYIEKALRNVERMVEIINDLESISMLESGELKLNPSRFDICNLTKEVFESLEMQAEQNKIRLAIKRETDNEHYVTGDQKLIREVLVNLIGNGIKYARKNGFVEVGFYVMDNQLLVEVADNGIGIAKEHQARVFERFFRADKSRTRELGGTGLGLSIVKHIIEAHGHSVSVSSTPGEGSTFSFTLSRN